jgi:hypothetical protein
MKLRLPPVVTAIYRKAPCVQPVSSRRFSRCGARRNSIVTKIIAAMYHKAVKKRERERERERE